MPHLGKTSLLDLLTKAAGLLPPAPGGNLKWLVLQLFDRIAATPSRVQLIDTKDYGYE